MSFSSEQVKAAFARAARTYDEAAVVQKEILFRLVEKLKIIHTRKVDTLLDLGSGTGLARESLSEHYGELCYFALDFAFPMLEFAKNEAISHSLNAVCANVEQLPFREASLDIIFSASTLQWSNDAEKVFQQCYQALKEQGSLIFSSFGPATLKELRYSFEQVDDHSHISNFVDIQTLGDSMLACGFSSPVMESEIITVEYTNPMHLLKDLQATGATNHNQEKLRGLMSRQRLDDALREYEKFVLPNGKYPASYEVLYGHGKKLRKQPARPSYQDDWETIHFHKD